MKLKHIYLIVLVSSASAFGSVALYNKIFRTDAVVIGGASQNGLPVNYAGFFDGKAGNPIDPIDFTKAAIQQGKDTAAQLKGYTKEQAARLTGFVEYYWIPAGGSATKNPDIRGLHTDAGCIMLGTADQPGLIVDRTTSPGVD